MDNSSLNEMLQNWLGRDPDSGMRQELLALQDAGKMEELAERFAGRLEFGTAGLRGLVGAGPSRMNRLVVRETTAGLADYLLKTVTNAATRGVVVTYDARPDSRQFAQDVTGTLLALGFKVYLTEDAQPTPVGAFGVLHLDAAAGIVVTASHNPPEYNGYKVYWENGSQIIPPHDAGIAGCIEKAATRPLNYCEPDEREDPDSLVLLGDDFVSTYRECVHQTLPTTPADSTLRVAYTPLHGVGAKIAASILEESGLCDLATVASQAEPDGRFPTVRFPNPEEPGAMDAVVALAVETHADLAVANDPDADRLAVAVRNPDNSYRQLSGDQVGALLGHFLLSQPRDKQAIACTTIVSSRLLQRIASAMDAKYCETLTGFKWLSNKGFELEDDTSEFLFAYEEALGYSIGRGVRDKDGLSALLAFVQMTSALASEGRTVIDQLEDIYRQFGVFVTSQRSIKTSPEQASIGDALRGAQPDEIGGLRVRSRMDLQNSTHVFENGETKQLDFFPSDVLVYFLEDDSRIIVRPSGTEPKVKIYYEVIGEIAAGQNLDEARTAAETRLQDLIESHQSLMSRVS